MTVNEFKRWLKKNGATFVKGSAKHEMVTLNGKASFVPRHGSHQIPIGTMNAVKKQLGL